MKWFLILLTFLLSVLQVQEFKIEQRCQVKSKYAMVVEHNGQYYVVETPQYFQYGWIIQQLDGINSGGYGTLHYSTNTTRSNQMEVRIASRFKWMYSGLVGAKSVCRDIVKGNF